MVGSVGMERGDYSLFVNGLTMSSVKCHHMEYTLVNHDFVLLFSSVFPPLFTLDDQANTCFSVVPCAVFVSVQLVFGV